MAPLDRTAFAGARDAAHIFGATSIGTCSMDAATSDTSSRFNNYFMSQVFRTEAHLISTIAASS